MLSLLENCSLYNLVQIDGLWWLYFLIYFTLSRMSIKYTTLWPSTGKQELKVTYLFKSIVIISFNLYEVN